MTAIRRASAKRFLRTRNGADRLAQNEGQPGQPVTSTLVTPRSSRMDAVYAPRTPITRVRSATASTNRPVPRRPGSRRRRRTVSPGSSRLRDRHGRPPSLRHARQPAGRPVTFGVRAVRVQSAVPRDVVRRRSLRLVNCVVAPPLGSADQRTPAPDAGPGQQGRQGAGGEADAGTPERIAAGAAAARESRKK